jgi:hypothetical protein
MNEFDPHRELGRLVDFLDTTAENLKTFRTYKPANPNSTFGLYNQFMFQNEINSSFSLIDRKIRQFGGIPLSWVDSEPPGLHHGMLVGFDGFDIEEDVWGFEVAMPASPEPVTLAFSLDALRSGLALS